MKPILNKLIFDLSSNDYHNMGGTYSSSQLKTMLDDPEVFYRKYITKEVAREESPAFDVGTFFHTAILEPEKLEEECVVYSEGIRRGSKWDAFKEANKGKAIITEAEKKTADTIINAVRNSPVSMGYLKTSKAEVSAFIEVYVLGGEVFSFRDGICHALISTGWAQDSLDYDESDIKDFGTKITLKVRADALGMGTGVISDLKSTTGNAKKVFEMQKKVADYQYDLSASLYLDVFTMASGELYDKFVWIFASKDMGNCRSYVGNDDNYMVGRAKWKYAVVTLAKYIENQWVFSDELGEIGPTYYNKQDWIDKI